MYVAKKANRYILLMAKTCALQNARDLGRNGLRFVQSQQELGQVLN